MSKSSGVYVKEFRIDAYCGIENDAGEVCDFDGTVDAWSDSELGIEGWTCPVCGHEHEDELGLPEPDWDDDWDIDDEGY